MKELSELFKINGIDHVFLKGAALLASGHYMDNAERMVGDIDVLIAPKQIAAAFNLLQSNGYNKTVGYAYKTIGFRHTDRLISETKLAAIELHVSLFNQAPSQFAYK